MDIAWPRAPSSENSCLETFPRHCDLIHLEDDISTEFRECLIGSAALVSWCADVASLTLPINDGMGVAMLSHVPRARCRRSGGCVIGTCHTVSSYCRHVRVRPETLHASASLPLPGQHSTVAKQGVADRRRWRHMCRPEGWGVVQEFDFLRNSATARCHRTVVAWGRHQLAAIAAPLGDGRSDVERPRASPCRRLPGRTAPSRASLMQLVKADESQ